MWLDENDRLYVVYRTVKLLALSLVIAPPRASGRLLTGNSHFPDCNEMYYQLYQRS